MQILLPAMAALVPLLITPGLLFYYDVTPKILVLVFGVVFAIVLAARGRKWLEFFSSNRPARWFSALLALQLISLLLSTAWSTNPTLSLNGGNWRRFGTLTQAALLAFTLLAAAWLVRDRRRLQLLLRTIALSGSLAAIYGILQYFGWDPLIASAAYRVGEAIWTIVRPPGTLGHADYFGAYLTYVAFSGAALALTERRIWRIAGAGSSALSTLALVLSGTRAAVVGLLIGGVLLAVVLRPRIRVRSVALAGLLLAGLIGLYFSPPGAPLRARVKWSREDPRGGARLLLWRDTLRMATHRPLLGYGPETFGTDFPRFQSVELARAFPDFYHESPHNAYLDAFVAQGLPGLLGLLAFTGLGFYAAWQSRIEQPVLAGTLAAALGAGVAAQQFMSFTLPTALYFCLTIAMLVSLLPAGVARTPPKPLRFLAGTARAVLAVFLSVYGCRLLMADSYLSRMQHDVEESKLESAIEDYAKAKTWQPAGSSTDLYYGRRMAQLAKSAPVVTDRLQAAGEAMNAAIRATQTAEDRQNAWYNLAAFHGGQNNGAAAEQSLRTAIDWAPNWFKPHWILAQVLRASGRTEEAEAQAAAAVNLDGGKHGEVDRTLNEIRAENRKTRGR